MSQAVKRKPPTFGYAALDKTDRVVVEQKTVEIRDRMGQAAQTVVEIGERLIVVKEKLGHGHFGAWLRAEFDWSYPTAARMMQVAEQFKSINLRDLAIAPSALYLLASPSTPDDVREQFIEAATNGEKVTHAEVKAAVAPPRPRPAAVVRRPASNGTLPLFAPTARNSGDVKPIVAPSAGTESNATRASRETDAGSPAIDPRACSFPRLAVDSSSMPARAGRGVELANKAIRILKSIPAKDALRDEGLRTVARWIKDNK